MNLFEQVPAVLAIWVIWVCLRAMLFARRTTDKVGNFLAVVSGVLMLTAHTDWLTPYIGINVWTFMNLTILGSMIAFTTSRNRR